MDFNKVKKIYMIGIKGVGMTMLAQFLATNGKEVSGSDTAEKFMTDEVLYKSKIKVIENFSEKNIPSGIDLIIYSSAYNKENNPEIACTLDGKKKALSYAEAMGQVFNQKYGVAVVGSHGKTTTTAWLSYVLEKSGLELNAMIGANVPQFGGFSLNSQSDLLIIEADEYQNKLKYFQPKGVLLNNIDYDHPDFFPTVADYESVFIEFIKKIPKKGFLIANFNNPAIRKIANVNCKGRVISYAVEQQQGDGEALGVKQSRNATGLFNTSGNSADYIAYDIKVNNGKQYFKVKIRESIEDCVVIKSSLSTFARGGAEELGDFCIQLSGRHNIANAMAVIVASIELGVELKDIRKHLEEFFGTERRMQKLGEFNGALIYDDYAHHPTEIKATLAGAREFFPKKKLIVVFHPHTFTRTKVLLNDFAQSFGDADEVIVLDIYGSARERQAIIRSGFGGQAGAHSKDLVKKIKNQKSKIKKILYIPAFDECEKYLRKNISKGDVVILMGAGDVFRIGEKLIK